MYGAILGDIIGSPFEFDRGNKSTEFELFTKNSVFTDDSVMTIAVAEALMNSEADVNVQKIKSMVCDSMQQWGRKYPRAGYGVRFMQWLEEPSPKPYGSYGNGSAMRVSSAGWLYDSLDKTREIARATAEITHNHPEGIKGAESVASAIFMARTGEKKNEIKAYIIDNFHYNLSRTCGEIRPYYHHVESCQETVPEAFTAFFEGDSFEEVIRLAVSLGGDCDTLTCIAGSIAEAYYGVPNEMIVECRRRLTKEMIYTLDEFDKLKLDNHTGTDIDIDIDMGNITQLDCKCIVNAANSSLLGGGGVDGAIHRAAGRELLEECRNLHGCKTGEAKITKGYNLKADYIIHTVGPIYSGSEQDKIDLENCYSNSLNLAKEHDIHSIGFPAISTGVYGYPLREATQIALSTVINWLKENKEYEMKVIFSCFNQKAYDIFQELMKLELEK